MKRVMIIGFSGAGKSTLAKRIAERIGCVPTHMDKIHWKSGWHSRTRDEKCDLLEPVLRKKKWVIDGNYTNVFFEGRLFLADTIIFLDFNRFLCLFRVIKRRIEYSGKTRSDMPKGCVERLDFEYLKQVVWGGRKKRRQYYQSLSEIKEQIPEKRIYILKKPSEVGEFLREMERNDL